MSFNSDGFSCKRCRRKGCLLKQRYFSIRNVPEKYGIKNDVLYWTSKKVWKFTEIIGNKNMPLITIIQTFFGICPKSIINPNAFGLLRRFLYCKTYSTSLFSGGYDDQPYEWILLCEIIENEIAKLTEWKTKDK